MAQTKRPSLVPVHDITRDILVLRGQRVLLDAQLADLYGVTTKALNQAVKRNAERFPEDFMFRLTQAETSANPRFGPKSSRSSILRVTENGCGVIHWSVAVGAL